MSDGADSGGGVWRLGAEPVILGGTRCEPMTLGGIRGVPSALGVRRRPAALPVRWVPAALGARVTGDPTVLSGSGTPAALGVCFDLEVGACETTLGAYVEGGKGVLCAALLGTRVGVSETTLGAYVEGGSGARRAILEGATLGALAVGASDITLGA